MSKTPQTHDLKIVSGVSMDGKIYAPGKIALAVPDKLARDLLARGKAELASVDDFKPAAKGKAAPAAAEPKPAPADKTSTPDQDADK